MKKVNASATVVMVNTKEKTINAITVQKTVQHATGKQRTVSLAQEVLDCSITSALTTALMVQQTLTMYVNSAQRIVPRVLVQQHIARHVRKT